MYLFYVDSNQTFDPIIFQFFVISAECALPFIDKFRVIHDWIDQKYEKKVLVIIDTQVALTYRDVQNIVGHDTVINGSLFSCVKGFST